jgi:hypothetical protein
MSGSWGRKDHAWTTRPRDSCRQDAAGREVRVSRFLGHGFGGAGSLHLFSRRAQNVPCAIANLEKSKAEEIVVEAKRIIDERLSR